MVGFAQNKTALDALGVKIVAGSVDPLEKSREVAQELNFAVAYGVTRQVGELLGSWWEERRNIIQPSEFILGADNKVLASSYADGPLGRIEAGDVVRWITRQESLK